MFGSLCWSAFQQREQYTKDWLTDFQLAIQGKTIIGPGSDNKYCQIITILSWQAEVIVRFWVFLTPERTYTSQILHLMEYLTNPFRKTSPFQRRRTDKTKSCFFSSNFSSIAAMFCIILCFFLVSSTNLFMLSKASWKGKIPFPCEAPAAPCHPAFCKRRIQTIQGRSLLPELENVKLLDESIVICWNLSYPLNHGQTTNTLSDSNYSLISSQIIFAA